MTFPLLKTGAVAQYPLERVTRFSTQSVRFLDGRHQRYRLHSSALRKWTVKLDLLGEEELGAVIAFADGQGSSVFSFRDPVSGTIAERCVLAAEHLDATMTREGNGQTTIVIEEIV